MKNIYKMILILGLLNSACASAGTIKRQVATTNENLTPEGDMLAAAKNTPVVTAYLNQSGLKAQDLQFVIAPKSSMLCTLMGDSNSCSMSFRALDQNGVTVMAAAIHFDGRKKTYSVFRIFEGAPREGSDFEAFARIPGQ
jgi:hypothetical protein